MFNLTYLSYLHCMYVQGDVTQQSAVDAVFASDPNITGVIVALGNSYTCIHT